MDQNGFKELKVILIKPSKYDDNGYVIRFWKGVLPSNTLSVLNGLTEDVKRRQVLGQLKIEIVTFDETAQKIPVKKIIRWSQQPSVKLVVGLVGVQTNQFPRALHLGKQFRAAGIDVIMGGFHTSGTINMLGDQEPEIQELRKESICIVSGEVEGRWGTILADAVNGELKPIYSFAQDLLNLVDLGDAPPPVMCQETMSHFAYTHFGTMDTSRGCPYSCSFCTIINVQGRKMRERRPEAVAEIIRKNYLEHGLHYYFFTDDNFARKKLWRQTFEALIALKEEGIKVDFMMQVDLARKPKGFVQLAAEAGCSQVFIGMESVNPENLKAEGKPQNHVDEYHNIIKEWQDANIAVHAGYIIGLPFDTKEQVSRDVQYLMETLQPDMTSFFMLTPLPGSQDHLDMKKRGEWMDPDLNKRDSFHATINHPRMTSEAWTDAYLSAWNQFYSKENMIRILSRWGNTPHVYWALMSNLIWYKNAALIEKEHPMIAGFFRLKDRLDRREGYAVDPFPVHLWERTKEISRLFVSWAKLLKEMEDIWLQTRKRSEVEERWLDEIQKIQGEIWQTLRIAEWRKVYNSAKKTLPAKAKAMLDPFEELSSKMLFTRKDLNRFLKQWEGLQVHIQKLRRSLTVEGEVVLKRLDELSRLHEGIRLGDRKREWQERYSRMTRFFPSKLPLPHVRFDVFSNRAVHSRQELQKFWTNTVQNLRNLKLWHIHPVGVVSALVKDFLLTTSFAFTFMASTRSGQRS